MKRILVLLTPLGIVLTELPIRVEFQSAVPALLGVPVPENHQGHVLPGRHFLLNSGIVRQLIAEIAAALCRVLPVDRLRNAIVRDPLRKRIPQRPTFLECTQEFIDARLADLEFLGNLPSAHVQGKVLCNDVLVI